jgi:hypothetical protein
VWLDDGEEAWVVIHVEIESQRDPTFAERMFVYTYRVYDRYHQSVISLAVPGDEDPAWRPNRFGYGNFGCTLELEFPIVKLLDYKPAADRWTTSNNLIAGSTTLWMRATWRSSAR